MTVDIYGLTADELCHTLKETKASTRPLEHTLYHSSFTTITSSIDNTSLHWFRCLHKIDSFWTISTPWLRKWFWFYAITSSFFTNRFFSKLKCPPRMNKLFQNFDIVISDNDMDIRNFLVLFASGTAGHETSIGLKRSGL
jgi:hypothetical protein